MKVGVKLGTVHTQTRMHTITTSLQQQETMEGDSIQTITPSTTQHWERIRTHNQTDTLSLHYTVH